MDDNSTERLALLVLGLIAVAAMAFLGLNGKEIALAIGSGIGGYLRGSNKTKG